MTRHVGAAELLQHHWLPDDDPSIGEHLAGCEPCRARLASLRHDLGREDSAAADQPDTFWKRQELGVMSAIAARERRGAGTPLRLAAAAAMIFVVGAFFLGRNAQPAAPAAPVVTATATATSVGSTVSQESGLSTSQITTDPWASDQLKDYQTVVDWETWVEDDGKNRGTI